MNKIIFSYVPDVTEPYIRTEFEKPFEECFNEIEAYCKEFKDNLERMEISISTIDKEPMFYICGIVPNYRIDEKFKYLEPQVLEIFNKYFKQK